MPLANAVSTFSLSFLFSLTALAAQPFDPLLHGCFMKDLEGSTDKNHSSDYITVVPGARFGTRNVEVNRLIRMVEVGDVIQIDVIESTEPGKFAVKSFKTNRSALAKSEPILLEGLLVRTQGGNQSFNLAIHIERNPLKAKVVADPQILSGSLPKAEKINPQAGLQRIRADIIRAGNDLANCKQLTQLSSISGEALKVQNGGPFASPPTTPHAPPAGR